MLAFPSNDQRLEEISHRVLNQYAIAAASIGVEASCITDGRRPSPSRARR
jgi:two-component sensor histidine kinase